MVPRVSALGSIKGQRPRLCLLYLWHPSLMGSYLLRRLLLVIPTLFGIIAINFVVVQFAPGGPVEQMIAELKGRGAGCNRTHDRRRFGRDNANRRWQLSGRPRSGPARAC